MNYGDGAGSAGSAWIAQPIGAIVSIRSEQESRYGREHG